MHILEGMEHIVLSSYGMERETRRTREGQRSPDCRHERDTNGEECVYTSPRM